MTETTPLLVSLADGVATVTLNRPEVRNAFDDTQISRMKEAFLKFHGAEGLRAVVIRAEGPAFCAGGDLNWMKKAATYTEEQNANDAKNLAEMLHTLHTIPCPTIALTHGAVYGGGTGVAAACDIVFTLKSAIFCLSEVKLGLLPSVISPYMLAAIGERNCRRYMLTAEPFNGKKAKKMGLAHEKFEDLTEMETALAQTLDALRAAGPEAVAATKRLIAEVKGEPLGNELIHHTARTLAHRRASAEAREGVSAFLEKRKPMWATS